MDMDIINRHQVPTRIFVQLIIHIHRKRILESIYVLTRITFPFSEIHPFHKKHFAQISSHISLTHLTHLKFSHHNINSFSLHFHPIPNVPFAFGKMMGPPRRSFCFWCHPFPLVYPRGLKSMGCGCLVLVGRPF